MSGGSSQYLIESVQRALDCLYAFCTAGPELAVAELSSQLGCSVSTTYRLLVTLESKGIVEHSSQNGKYRLGVACLELAAAFLSGLDLRQRVLPTVAALRDLCRETVHLGVLDLKRMEVIYVEKVDALLPIGMMGSKIGARVRADCTALGRCMLAHLPQQTVREFYAVQGLTARTPNTITDLDRLLEVLATVRQQGYATDHVEHELGVMCVAAPVWDHMNQVVGAISVSGPDDRMKRHIAEYNLVENLKTAAQEASRRMGHSQRAEHKG